jgi:hypothetical protein
MIRYLVPGTRAGAWALAAMAGVFVFYGLFHIPVALGQRGGDTFFSNLYLAVPVLLIGLSGVAAFLAGLYAVIRRRERAVFVFIATLVGLFVLVFIIGEIACPH